MEFINKTEEICNIYNRKLDNSMSSLYDITIDTIVSDILSGKKSLKSIKSLPESLENAILKRIEPIDKYIWQQKILESAIQITFSKCFDVAGDWQKFYDEEGCRDFHEVIYFKHSEQEDYIEVNQFDNEFYYTYQQVLHKMYPDPELEGIDFDSQDY